MRLGIDQDYWDGMICLSVIWYWLFSGLLFSCLRISLMNETNSENTIFAIFPSCLQLWACFCFPQAPSPFFPLTAKFSQRIWSSSVHIGLWNKSLFLLSINIPVLIIQQKVWSTNQWTWFIHGDVVKTCNLKTENLSHCRNWHQKTGFYWSKVIN